MEVSTSLIAVALGTWRANHRGGLEMFLLTTGVFGTAPVVWRIATNPYGRWPDAMRIQVIRDARAAFGGSDDQ